MKKRVCGCMRVRVCERARACVSTENTFRQGVWQSVTVSCYLGNMCRDKYGEQIFSTTAFDFL